LGSCPWSGTTPASVASRISFDPTGSSISEGIGADNASVGCEWSCHPDPEGTPSFGWQPMRNRKRGCVIIKNPFPGSMQVSGGRILHSPYLEILESEALKIIALGGSS